MAVRKQGDGLFLCDKMYNSHLNPVLQNVTVGICGPCDLLVSSKTRGDLGRATELENSSRSPKKTE